MTVRSAREQLGKMDSPDGYCIPLALDSIMEHTVLPDKYYQMFKATNDVGGGHNQVTTRLIEEFFEQPAGKDTDMAAVAKFNAFGASEQPYFSDVPYEYPDNIYVKEGLATEKQVRLYTVLEKARERGCNVLFAVNSEHFAGIQLVDPGGLYKGQQTPAWYALRDCAMITGNKLHDVGELSGLSPVLNSSSEERGCIPLPEISRPSWPAGQTSWELIILPPEPMGVN